MGVLQAAPQRAPLPTASARETKGERGVADVFISYSKQHSGPTYELAAVLEARGYSIWWDTSLIAGADFTESILRELDEALAVVVIWTPASIKSAWVISEAERGRRAKKLIPLRLPEVSFDELPPPFNTLHTDLVDDLERLEQSLTTLGVLPAHTRTRHRRRKEIETLPDEDYESFVADRQYDPGEAALVVKVYTQVIARSPASAPAYNNRGHALAELGEHDRAIADFSKAIMLSTEMRDTIFHNRAAAYHRAGNFDRAIADYSTALKLSRDSPMIHLQRGMAYEAKGDLTQAMAGYNKAIELHSEYAEAFAHRGLGYAKTGDRARAIKDFYRALSLEPDLQLARDGLAQVRQSR
jgi:tetratricopeptide (TPR) repeat protein